MLLKRIIHHSRSGTLSKALAKMLKRRLDPEIIQKKIEEAAARAGPENQEPVVAILQRHLSLHRPKAAGLPNACINLLAEIISAGARKDSPPEGVYEECLEKLATLPAALLSCAQWKVISYLAIRNGAFRLGGVLREQAVENAYISAEELSGSAGPYLEAFKVAVEEGAFEKAAALLAREPVLDLGEETLKRYRHYLLLCSGEQEEAAALAQSFYNTADRRFAEIVGDKKVALAGPAPVSEQAAGEIDSYELVLRLNYRGRKYLEAAGYEKARADISYYNLDNAAWIASMDDRSFLKDLKQAVFKHFQHAYQEELVRNQLARVIFPLDKVLFSGSANMIQFVLFDLAHFAPRTIKLFGANLFFTSKAYSNGYELPVNIKKAVSDSWHIFAFHDLITQFKFTKNLWQAGIFEADPILKEVLDLSTRQYLAGMEDLYVRSGVC